MSGKSFSVKSIKTFLPNFYPFAAIQMYGKDWKKVTAHVATRISA